MKRVLIFTFASMMFCYGVKGQEYLPILSEGKTWICVDGHMQDSKADDTDSKFTIAVQGDTIVGGKEMKKVVWKYSDGYTDSYAAYEESGKLYSYFKRYDEEKETLMLMYDMNWKVGDETMQGKVTDVDEIEVRGIKRKRIKVGEGEYSTYIVEGIGADWLWYFSGIAPDMEDGKYMYSKYITECYDNEALIFTQEDFAADSTTSLNIVSTNQAECKQTIYDISGKQISKPLHGNIYICKGKKMIK